MGRRKKEPADTHRAAIAAAAETLFRRQGVEATTMDEIAREAGYSKATLYVYFQNKEEIVAALALESMRLLYACIHKAIAAHTETKAQYEGICWALAGYQARYPAYFGFVLGTLRADMDAGDMLPVERETYAVGEQINAELSELLRSGIAAGALQWGLPLLPTVFTLWGSLSGLILLADRKRAYLQQALGLSQEEFLQSGFALLYRSIAAEGGAL